jgi:hypothetical protein
MSKMWYFKHTEIYKKSCTLMAHLPQPWPQPLLLSARSIASTWGAGSRWSPGFLCTVLISCVTLASCSVSDLEEVSNNSSYPSLSGDQMWQWLWDTWHWNEACCHCCCLVGFRVSKVMDVFHGNLCTISALLPFLLRLGHPCLLGGLSCDHHPTSRARLRPWAWGRLFTG